MILCSLQVRVVVVIVLVVWMVVAMYVVLIVIVMRSWWVVGVVKGGGLNQFDGTHIGGILSPWPFTDWTCKLPVY